MSVKKNKKISDLLYNEYYITGCCAICPIGNYIQNKFYDEEDNDAICFYCKKKEEEQL